MTIVSMPEPDFGHQVEDINASVEATGTRSGGLAGPP